ncbi:MAG: hypothetical protein ACKOSR_15660, partial [Flavobacteriales bacterium]
MKDLRDINALLQSMEDSAVVRKDSILLDWKMRLQGLAEEREELVQRADSVSLWSMRLTELLS